MMWDFLQNNWGNLASATGLFVTIVGFWLAVGRATQARTSADASRSAAKAAQDASIETRTTIAKMLTVVDLERAISLIDRLKAAHRGSKWEVALEHYSGLRGMLADIEARHPDPAMDGNDAFRNATAQLRVIEDSVDKAIRENGIPEGSQNFNDRLNDIQQALQHITSQTQFSD